MVFFNEFDRFFPNADADKAVVALVAYQTAFSQKEYYGASERVHIFDMHPQGPMVPNKELKALRRNYEIAVDWSDAEPRFKIHLTPTARAFPLPPYNVFHKRPSYLADHLGNIRMIYVNGRTPCPPDAPVVMRVSKTDIERILAGRKQ